MDVRTSANPVVVALRDWLEVGNRRHPWSHNDHFHGWVLRNLPVRRQRALDVGCGRGALLERLAPRFARVDGIDVDEAMIASASARLAGLPNVEVDRRGLDELAAEGGGRFDLITMVAVLHHLDLEATLSRVPALLAPGGRLLVVGLARASSPSDLLLDCLSAVANPVMGLLKHPRRAREDDGGAQSEPAMPAKDPSATWAEIVAATRTHLPGASARRRLFFRYTLAWEQSR